MTDKSDNVTFFQVAVPKDADWQYDDDTKQWVLDVESCEQFTIHGPDSDVEYRVELDDALWLIPIDSTQSRNGD